MDMLKEDSMAKLTKDQIEFAKAMTIKQRGVLNSLSMYDCYMSASEMADDELKEIIRHQLARYYAPPGLRGVCHGARPMPVEPSRN
jgi:hypothetical protein